MKLFGRDCGCEGRKRWMARRLRSALGLSEHLTIMEGHLTARVYRANGRVEDLDLGPNTITDAAVAFMVDDMDNDAQDITTLNYHAWGTGACSTPICGATTLVTEAAESRVSGTKSQPSANQLRTIATITSASTQTITEWGLFSASTGGTAWSLRCFTGIGVDNGDKIEFTYTLTINCVSG